MAVGQLSTTNGTGSATAGVAATATITANVGDTLIVVAGSDDRASAEAMSATAVTDSASNTWTRLLTLQNQNATANDFCAAAIYGTVVTNALSSGTVTLTPVATVPVKDFTLYRFTGLSLTIRGSNSGSGSVATPPALTSSTPLNGDLVIGVTVLEGPTTDTWTADSDTTNGPWSTNATDGTTSATAAANITIRSQYKIVSADGTQSYDGSNSVARDTIRLLLVLVPSPPPAAAPAPPPFKPAYTNRVSISSGRSTAALVDAYAVGPNFDPTLPPVIYNSTVYNIAAELAGVNFDGLNPIVQALTDAGFLIVAPTTQGTWGNSTAVSTSSATGGALGDSILWAQSLGAATGPVVQIGASEGGIDALAYAFNWPANTVCVVGIIPAIDLQEIREQDWGGLRASVDAAWAVTYPTALPAGADPFTHTTTLRTVPQQIWYATDDPVSANITTYQTNTGCDIRSVGQYGHTNAAVQKMWPTEIVKYIKKHVGRAGR